MPHSWGVTLHMMPWEKFGAKVNQHPPIYHPRWMMLKYEILFGCIHVP